LRVVLPELWPLLMGCCGLALLRDRKRFARRVCGGDAAFMLEMLALELFEVALLYDAGIALPLAFLWRSALDVLFVHGLLLATGVNTL
jgi:hypothetical protein